MKKIFSLVLAAAMVLSLGAVAFAADATVSNASAMSVDTSEQYRYSSDKNTMTYGVVEYGNAIYYPILGLDKTDYAANGTMMQVPTTALHLLSDKEVVDGLKIKAKYEQGQDLVESLSIVKKQVVAASFDNKGVTNDDGFYYFIELKTKAKETTSDADIIGTFTLNKTKSGDDKFGSFDGQGITALNYKVKDLKVDFSANVGYEDSYYAAETSNVNGFYGTFTNLKVDGDVGDGDMKPGNYYLMKFDCDDEVEFSFGKEPNEGTFTVDVSGQSKLLLKYDTIIDEGIADANVGAKIFALSFNDTKFNRTGEFMYEGEDFEYAYQLNADGSLKLLGEFDNEEVTFKTRVLGSYLFSDVELVAAPAAVETPEEVPADVVTVNPGTGAAC